MVNIDFENFEKRLINVRNVIELQNNIGLASRKFNNKSNNEAVFYFPSLIDDVVNLLEILTNDKDSWISYWVFELDCGKKYKDGMILDKDKNPIKLKEIEDLWNLLTHNLCTGCSAI